MQDCWWEPSKPSGAQTLREMGERVAPSGQQVLPRFFGSLSFILRIIVQNLKGKKRTTVSPARLYCDSGSNDKTNCNVCKI